MNLPESWVLCTLDQVADTSSGGTPSRSRAEYYGGTIPWVKSGELGDGAVTETEERITENALENSSAKIFPKGTLCIALYGATVGKLGILEIDAATNQAVCGIFQKPGLIAKYLFYFFQLKRPKLIAASQGGAQPNISQAIVRSVEVPVAPTSEQARIVAEIEKQFTRLDAAVAGLKRVHANLKRYRASLLKAACEGRLVPTEAELARKEGRDYEAAGELLKRILSERRANWETGQLQKMIAAGKPPKDDLWKAKYAEPCGVDQSNLPKLAEGWIWVRAEQVCNFITKGTTPDAHKLYQGSGDIPYIKVYNLTNHGGLDFSYKPTFIDQNTHAVELARSKVYPSDVLMNIVGPPLGKVSIVPDLFPEWNINQAIAIFRPFRGLSSQFLAHALMTDSVLEWAIRQAKATAGQFNLTLELCRDLPLPLAPEAEQVRINEDLSRRFSAIEVTHLTLEKNSQRARFLWQSVLGAAFSGELVPQDPSDESASVLLERIRSQHVMVAAAKGMAHPISRNGRSTKRSTEKKSSESPRTVKAQKP